MSDETVEVLDFPFRYDSRYVSTEEVIEMVLGMLCKSSPARPERVQKMLDQCVRIRSNPAWKGDDHCAERKSGKEIAAIWRKERENKLLKSQFWKKIGD